MRPYTAHQSVQNQLGATLLEYAIAFPIFMLVILSTMDALWVLAIKSRLSAGAESAMQTAKTLEYVGQRGDETNLTDPFGQALKIARAEIIDAGLNTATGVLVGDCASTKPAKLICAYNIDPATGIAVSAADSILVLRPGESGEFDTSAGKVKLEHPTIPRSSPGKDPYRLMEHHPIVIEMRAQVDRLFPFLPPLILTARAVGLRENFPVDEIPPGVTTTTTTVTTVPTVSTITTTSSTSSTSWPCVVNWSLCMQFGKCPTEVGNPLRICTCGFCNHPTL